MPVDFAIGIPTINRWDLLRPTLERYVADFPNTQIIVLDNGKQQIDFTHDNIEYTAPKKEFKSVAQSWNTLIEDIFNIPFLRIKNAIILNDDVYWGIKEKELQKYIENNPAPFYVCPHHYCCFIITKKLYNTIGPFDEGFLGAYFEDNDYNYRLHLAEIKYNNNDIFSPEIYRESSSGKKNVQLQMKYMDNYHRYIAKWGGIPGEEKFKTPFNQ